jgi:cytochrome c oxidase subunit 2
MQTLAAQITVFFLIVLVLCFVWVLRRTGLGKPQESMPTSPYRLRNRLFMAVMLGGVVISLTTLLPWPHDAGAAAVTRSIDVKAKQWAWELSDDKARVGEVIEFRVTSEDVNHSFALYDEQRQMLTQIQAMPGFVNKVRHRFTAPGNYQILCLEYCGLAHHGMVAAFTVHAAP